jgi:cytochrome b6-f complex iron-sulfur subunit
MERRDFLLGACAAATCACSGFTVFRYLVPPSGSGRSGPVEVATRQALIEKGHLLVPFRGAAALVIYEAGRLRAFNPRCTHAGCLVEWRSKDQKFFCPCHGGVFNAQGERVAGPPPSPLAPIRAVLRGDKVYLGE